MSGRKRKCLNDSLLHSARKRARGRFQCANDACGLWFDSPTERTRHTCEENKRFVLHGLPAAAAAPLAVSPDAKRASGLAQAVRGVLRAREAKQEPLDSPDDNSDSAFAFSAPPASTVDAAFADIGMLLRDMNPRQSSTYPYDNLSTGLFHLWLASSPLPRSRVQSLLDLFADPRFDIRDLPRHFSAFAALDETLMTNEQQSLVSSALEIAPRPRSAIPPRTQVSAQPHSLFKHVRVPYVSIIGKLEEFLNDPIRRKSLHLPELNLLQPTAVGEFWQSRFATAPLAFSGNRAFWSRGLLAFQLNHAARLVDGTEVFILGLYYREGDVTDAALCRPELRVRCGKYMRAADAGKWLNGAEEAPSLDDDALVFVDNKMDLPPEVFDMPLDGDDCPSALWMYDDEHGWREGSPAELLLRYPALQPGEVRLSLDLFVDAFSARSSRAHSITAVYLTVNNMLLEERMRDENIIIAALGSPKVSPPELLAQFRQDMRRLEDGVLMNNFSDPSRPFRVFATIGLLPGDHMQHVAMCRHLGNAATLADRSSWITKRQRLDCTIDLWDASVMRRRDQTDVVGTQLLREAEVKAHREEKRQAASALRLDVAALVDRDPVREERMKPLRTKYGVKGDQPCPLEGLEVDPPLQAPRDPQHMLYFGLQRLLMTNCYQGMSADQKDNALQRQQDFAWPSGFARITYDFTTKISARYSMEFTAKMFLIVVLTWSDLVPPAKFAVLCQLFAISNKIFAKTRTPDQLETLQDLVTVFIGAAHAEFGELVNRPNMHNLFALVQKDLVLWPNALLFSTNFYECRHQAVKGFAAGSRLHSPEAYALACVEKLSRLQYLLHGGMFKDKHGRRRMLGSAIRGLADHRPGHEHRPHQIVRDLTSLMPALQRSPFVESKGTPASGSDASSASSNGEAASGRGSSDSADAGGASSAALPPTKPSLRHVPAIANSARCGAWFPAKYMWTAAKELDCSALLPQEERLLREALSEQFADLRDEVAAGRSLTVVFPQVLISRPGLREMRLRLGDDVDVLWDGKDSQTARIAKLVVALTSIGGIPFLVPQYFSRTKERHPLLDVPILGRYAENKTLFNRPLLLECIQRQVMVVHDCLRVCESRECKQQREAKAGEGKRAAAAAARIPCGHVCATRRVCEQHQVPRCAVARCADRWVLRDVHAADHFRYVMLDREHGFIAQHRRLQLWEMG